MSKPLPTSRGSISPLWKPSWPSKESPFKLEEHFQQAIEELATHLGWLVYRTRNSKGSDPGFPDIVAVQRSVFYIECKNGPAHLKRFHLRPEQERWRQRLLGIGEEYWVARPDDWVDGQVEHYLTMAR